MKICIKRVPNLMITGVRNEKHFSLEVYDSVSMKILLWFKIFLSRTTIVCYISWLSSFISFLCFNFYETHICCVLCYQLTFIWKKCFCKHTCQFRYWNDEVKSKEEKELYLWSGYRGKGKSIGGLSNNRAYLPKDFFRADISKI